MDSDMAYYKNTNFSLLKTAHDSELGRYFFKLIKQIVAYV